MRIVKKAVSAVLGTADTLYYAVPGGTRAEITSFWVHNTDGSAATVRVRLQPASGDGIYPVNLSLGAGHTLYPAPFLMDAGDSLYAYAGTDAVVQLHVSLEEQTE